MEQTTDILIIGAGPGGYVAAIKAGQLGYKTTLVDKRPRPGGTCLNVGCIPSKALLHSSHYYHMAQNHFKDYGIEIDAVTLNLDKMLGQKNKVVDDLTKGILFLLKKNQVDWVQGAATFQSANTVVVTKEDGSQETIQAKHIIIATGSEVISLPGIEVDEKVVVSSTGALSFEKVPEKLLVVGAGYIGLELGSVWSRLGAQVKVIEASDKFLPMVDHEAANLMLKELQHQGLDIHLETKLESIAQKNGKADVTIQKNDGTKETLSFDAVLLSIGRKPNTQGLNLENIGVTMDGRGFIPVNGNYQTNIPNVYAIGDVIPGPMLAHRAHEDGITCVERINGQKSKVHYDLVPAVIYTSPEIASVGKTENQLKEAGINYKIGKFPFAANSRAKAISETIGFVKILTDALSDKILGVHIIGDKAGDLIAECVTVMEYGGAAEDIARTCHAHPTHAEAVKEAALAAYLKPIHV